MADRKIQAFNGRVARIEQAFRQGKGFEAAGTLGRSHYARQSRRRFSLAGPVLVICIGVIGVKAGIHHAIGGGNYDQRVEQLWQGDTLERAGALLMQADPATLYLSAQIGRLLN